MRRFSDGGLGILKRISPLPLGLSTKASECGENVQRMGNFLTISVRRVIPRVLWEKVLGITFRVVQIPDFFKEVGDLISSRLKASSHSMPQLSRSPIPNLVESNSPVLAPRHGDSAQLGDSVL